DLPALLLLHDPMIASSFDSAGQGGVTWRQENPAIGYGQDFAIGGTDGIRGRARGEGRAVGHTLPPCMIGSCIFSANRRKRKGLAADGTSSHRRHWRPSLR